MKYRLLKEAALQELNEGTILNVTTEGRLHRLVYDVQKAIEMCEQENLEEAASLLNSVSVDAKDVAREILNDKDEQDMFDSIGGDLPRKGLV